MCTYIISKIEVKRDILDNPMYDAIFSVEEVNKLAADGMPFRDAYKKVGLEIEAGKFVPNKDIHHTHEGSIGNLCNDRIVGLMDSIMQDFHFEKVDKAIKALLLG
jgi:argininosuccinate lyase